MSILLDLALRLRFAKFNHFISTEPILAINRRQIEDFSCFRIQSSYVCAAGTSLSLIVKMDVNRWKFVQSNTILKIN